MNPLRKILSVMRERRFLIYTEPFRLNIVGVRSASTIPNSFDDTINVFYKDNRNRWHFHSWRATTDPGTYWLNSPSNPKGTAILAQGQYLDAYTLANHRDNPRHPALCQRLKPVTVIRDYDRDAVLDFFNGSLDEGMHGINIHRASSQGTTKFIDRYSAGCQVFADREDFNAFLRLCLVHHQLHDNQFTYTLIDERATRRASRRRLLYRSGIGLALSGLVAWATTQTHKPIDQ